MWRRCERKDHKDIFKDIKQRKLGTFHTCEDGNKNRSFKFDSRLKTKTRALVFESRQDPNKAV